MPQAAVIAPIGADAIEYVSVWLQPVHEGPTREKIHRHLQPCLGISSDNFAGYRP